MFRTTLGIFTQDENGIWQQERSDAKRCSVSVTYLIQLLLKRFMKLGNCFNEAIRINGIDTRSIHAK